MFIAIFVVAGTMALIIQQREHEVALLRAIGATPGQVRRMIAWEAVIISFIAAAAGVVPGALLGEALARGFVRHSIAPPSFTVTASWLPAAVAIVQRRHRGAVRGALGRTSSVPCRADARARRRSRRATWNRPREADRRRPRDRLRRAAVLRLDGDAQPADSGRHVRAERPLPRRRRRFPRADRRAHRSGLLRPVLSGISPVGGFLAAANLRAATRRFSSASTPLVLSVALSCTLLFSSTTIDHAVKAQRSAGLTRISPSRASASVCRAQLSPTCVRREAWLGGGTHADDARPGRRRPLRRRDFGAGAGRRRGRRPRRRRGRGLAGRASRHDDRAEPDACRRGARARGRPRFADARRRSSQHATLVAIYTRGLGFGDALLAPELAAGHLGNPLLQTILVRATRRPRWPPSAQLAARYPGLRVSDRTETLASVDDADRDTNRWLTPLFVAIIFAFTSIAVVNTLAMIALRRGRELALLRLTGATRRQVRSMARWEAILTVAIGLGVGLPIAATASLPLSHALTGGYRPYVPGKPLVAILGPLAVLALLALAVPTRRALRTRPIAAVGVAE